MIFWPLPFWFSATSNPRVISAADHAIGTGTSHTQYSLDSRYRLLHPPASACSAVLPSCTVVSRRSRHSRVVCCAVSIAASASTTGSYRWRRHRRPRPLPRQNHRSEEITAVLRWKRRPPLSDKWKVAGRKRTLQSNLQSRSKLCQIT